MINGRILKNNYQNSSNLNIFERQEHSGEKMLSVLDPGGGTVVLFIVL